jgi:hypothetical protein
MGVPPSAQATAYARELVAQELATMPSFAMPKSMKEIGPFKNANKVRVQLSRSQVRAVAERLGPYLDSSRTIDGASKKLGVGEEIVRSIQDRKACVNLSLIALMRLAKAFDLDISGWDVTRDT